MKRTSTHDRAIRRLLRRGTFGLAVTTASGILMLAPMAAPTVSAQTLPMTTVRQATDNDPSAALRVTLNRLTEQHVLLAGAATGAAIDGRQAEFQAASAELDKNSQAIAGVIGSFYGPAAQDQFLKLWRAHIGFFGEYAMAAAKNDVAGKQQALAKLDGYRMDIDALLTGANPNLAKGSVAELFKPHVEHLTAAIDAQAAGNPMMAYQMLDAAAAQSRMISDPLADAIVAQFPERFDMSASADQTPGALIAWPPDGGQGSVDASNDSTPNDDNN
ncbi:MAG: hypothetical protein U0893_25475 [Chloroflexota bacterium]